ncbi:DNA polymerase IV [Paenibacillus sp. y28]|uniref:DNA polymerase IV n=1 Tax=Paenibacillus sp. y28 TaxID=3129110 RepID=UPI003017EB54
MNKPQAHRTIFLADCQSFYASVEKAAHPGYKERPLVVAGDPARRSGIVLAACPLAKARGITTAQRLGEALSRCSDLVVVQPHMEQYIRVSLQITDILRCYSDLVEPYSIDEQFLDLTGSQELLGGPLDIARHIQLRVLQETGVYTRIGISENKVLAKMACDNFAKKHPEGIYTLPNSKLDELWRLPVHCMFMIGSRMTQHLQHMGIQTIGELAGTPLGKLRAKWGMNGEVLWRIANGIDNSPVTVHAHDRQQAIGHQMTLPRDYSTEADLHVILLELADLVCRRCRAKRSMGQVVSVGCQGADYEHPGGFYRQMKLHEPTNLAEDVYHAAKQLLQRHWDGLPVRKVAVNLSGLVSDRVVQLHLFEDRDKKLALAHVTDRIKQKYGDAAIIRAASRLDAGQAEDRAGKIGGHYK